MRKLILIIALFSCIASYAQNRSRRYRKAVEKTVTEVQQDTINIDTLSMVDCYVDSLKAYRHQLDSLQALNDSLVELYGASESHESRYSRLFTPISFYSDLAHRHFSLDDDDAKTTEYVALVDDALMNIYINHPDLVKGKAQIATAKEKKREEASQKTQMPTEPAPIVTPKAEEIDVAPIDLYVSKPNFWTISGEEYLQVMQNYYSGNWYQGGESSYSAIEKFTLQANYNNKQKVKFDNRIEMNIGLQTNRSDTYHKVKTSSDLIRYTGKLGLQASKKWYYTLQLVTSSQFAKSYASNSNSASSAFLSPFVVNVSLGMDYTMNWFHKSLTGTIHLAPIALNYKYCHRPELAVNNGIPEGKKSKNDYGSNITLDGTWKLSDNVSWKIRLYYYTTYKRADLQWENTINLKVSRYIAASIYIYPRFDDSRARDDKYGYFQLKEYTSLGLTYSF